MDAIGVIISPNGDGKFDVYRIMLADGKILSIEPVTGGEGRGKRSAIKVVEHDWAAISQALTRGQIEFGSFEEDE